MFQNLFYKRTYYLLTQFNYVVQVGYVNCLIRAHSLMKVGMTLQTT